MEVFSWDTVIILLHLLHQLNRIDKYKSLSKLIVFNESPIFYGALLVHGFLQKTSPPACSHVEPFTR
jgi:hypothetical protein